MKSILKSLAAFALACACALSCAAQTPPVEKWDISFNVSASASTSLSVIPIGYYDCGYTPLMLVTATVTKTVRIPTKAGREYLVTYKNIYGAQLTPPNASYSNFTAQIDEERILTQTLTVTWLACYNPHIPPVDAAAYVASHGIDVAEVTERATVVTSKDLNGDGKSDKYIATNILDSMQTLSNGDEKGFMRIPSSFGTISQDNLMVSVRGRFVTLKELAEQMGKAVSDILNIQIAGGRFDITIKQVAVNAITSSVYQWALRKLGAPDSFALNLGVGDANPFVPLYKARYDTHRREYLGDLSWQGTGLAVPGRLIFQPNAAAISKVKLYRSPDKKAPEVSWTSSMPIDDPLAVRDFYLEGRVLSGSMNDVVIGFQYVPESGSASVSLPATLTVYDVQYMMYKRSSYIDALTPNSDAANFAAKVNSTTNPFTDNDLEEVGLPVALPLKTRYLKVGKWENAFNGNAVRQNFVSLDQDQFVVRVQGFGNGNPSVSLALSTEHATALYPRLNNLQNPAVEYPHLVNDALPVAKEVWASYNDPAKTIALQQRPAASGKFYTGPQLLVTDANDDAEPTTPADNAPNDSTHRIALGGKVVVKPTINGKVQPAFFLENKDEKTISVNVVVFNLPTTPPTPVRSLAAVTDEWKAVAERFAQVGIKVDYTIRFGVVPASAANINNVVAFDGAVGIFPSTGLGASKLTTQAKTIIDNHRAAGGGIHNFFYVNEGIQRQTTNLTGFAKAVAFQAFLLNATNSGYADCVFLVGNDPNFSTRIVDLLTASHEMAHNLINDYGQNPSNPANPSHHASPQNLLYEQSGNSRSSLGTKRLDSWQDSKIRTRLQIP